jgi:hypothetical protein
MSGAGPSPTTPAILETAPEWAIGGERTGGAPPWQGVAQAKEDRTFGPLKATEGPPGPLLGLDMKAR